MGITELCGIAYTTTKAMQSCQVIDWPWSYAKGNKTCLGELLNYVNNVPFLDETKTLIASLAIMPKLFIECNWDIIILIFIVRNIRTR